MHACIEDAVTARRDLGDGRYLGVILLTFGRARLIIGRVDDDIGHDDSW